MVNHRNADSKVEAAERMRRAKRISEEDIGVWDENTPVRGNGDERRGAVRAEAEVGGAEEEVLAVAAAEVEPEGVGGEGAEESVDEGPGLEGGFV